MLQRQRIHRTQHAARRRGELLSDSNNTSGASSPQTPPIPPFGVTSHGLDPTVMTVHTAATALHAIDQNSNPDKGAVHVGGTTQTAAPTPTPCTREDDGAPAVVEATRLSQPRLAPHLSFAPLPLSHVDTEIDTVVRGATQPDTTAPVHVPRSPPGQTTPDARRLFTDTHVTAELVVSRGTSLDTPPLREGSYDSVSDTPNPRLHNAYLTLRQHQQATHHPATRPDARRGELVSATERAVRDDANKNGRAVPPLTDAALTPSSPSAAVSVSPGSARRDCITRIEHSLAQLQVELAKEKRHNLEAEQRIFALQREMDVVRAENAGLVHALERYRRAYPSDAAAAVGTSDAQGDATTLTARVRLLEQQVNGLTEVLQARQLELDTKNERIRRLEHKLADTLLAAESPSYPTHNAEHLVHAIAPPFATANATRAPPTEWGRSAPVHHTTTPPHSGREDATQSARDVAQVTNVTASTRVSSPRRSRESSAPLTAPTQPNRIHPDEVHVIPVHEKKLGVLHRNATATSARRRSLGDVDPVPTRDSGGTVSDTSGPVARVRRDAAASGPTESALPTKLSTARTRTRLPPSARTAVVRRVASPMKRTQTTTESTRVRVGTALVTGDERATSHTAHPRPLTPRQTASGASVARRPPSPGTRRGSVQSTRVDSDVRAAAEERVGGSAPSLAPPPPRSMLACRHPSPARSMGVTSVRMQTAMRARPQISYNAKEDATTIKGTTTTVVLRGATPTLGRSGSVALVRPPSRSGAVTAQSDGPDAMPLVPDVHDSGLASVADSAHARPAAPG